MSRRLAGIQKFVSRSSTPSTRNLLINGDFRVAQRAIVVPTTTIPNTNDTYGLDRWNMIYEGSDSADYSRVTTSLPTGAAAYLQMETETGGEKFGVVQIIESSNCIHLQGQYVSLSFLARRGVGFSDVGASVLSWDSTADAVTSDVFVGAWGATAAAPTPTTNWTLESTSVDAGTLSEVADIGVWFQVKMPGILIDTANMTNIAVAIYNNDTTATTVDNDVDITNVMLNEGKTCAPFERRSIATEIDLCQRYFQKTYDEDTDVGAITDVGRMLHTATRSNAAFGTDMAVFQWQFQTKMRTAPTVIVYSPDDGAADSVWSTINAANLEALGEESGPSGATWSTADPATATTLEAHATAEAEL